MPEYIWEIGASGWFYYKEICYDARSHERKIRLKRAYGEFTVDRSTFGSRAKPAKSSRKGYAILDAEPSKPHNMKCADTEQSLRIDVSRTGIYHSSEYVTGV